MTWTWTHHISFPHFLGKGNLSLINYESEKFPQGLMQGQKIAIDLKTPPPQRPLEHHFGPDPPLDIGGLPALTQGQRSKGGKASQTEAPTPGEPPELQAGGSGKALPTKMAPHPWNLRMYSRPPPPDYA